MNRRISIFFSVFLIGAFQATPSLVTAKEAGKDFVFCFGDQDKSVCPDWELLGRTAQQVEWSEACKNQIEIKNRAEKTNWPQGAVCTFCLEPDGNISDLFVKERSAVFGLCARSIYSTLLLS
jgi:hypothetical protein